MRHRPSLRSASSAVALLLATSLLLAGCGGSDDAGSDSLTEIADSYGTDKGTTKHHFTEFYGRFFDPIRLDVERIFEIGVAGGKSMHMFRDYFPNATIYGIDIHATPELDSERIKTFVVDQANRAALGELIATIGGDFDLILDDGAHQMLHQQVSFGYLLQFVKPGGYYVIEDLQTSLVPGIWGVEAEDRRSTTLAMVNRFITSGAISSKYMTSEETQYLSRHLLFGTIFSRNKGRSITSLFKKR